MVGEVTFQGSVGENEGSVAGVNDGVDGDVSPRYHCLGIRDLGMELESHRENEGEGRRRGSYFIE